MEDRSSSSAHERTPEAYASANATRFVGELAEFVGHPSVSSDSRHAGDTRRCAAWLARHLRAIGLEAVRVAETGGHPVVCGQWLHAPGRATVLVYGHYDVQPADPAHEWSTPPFAPAIRGDRLYGRGAADDKGQMFTHFKAIESWLRTSGALPVNVKCLLEGEEETGSTHLPAFLAAHPEAGAADAAVVSDMRILGPDRPSLTESLRGALRVELMANGSGRDLHSGNYGGAVHNPLQALCAILAQLHDRRGRVAIPGFYDRVCDLSPRQRSEMAVVGPSDAEILKAAGTAWSWGEPGYTAYERTTIRPALTITAVRGGHQGPGAKAIIPATASAMLDFRLVADQDPAEIERLVRRFVARIVPASVRLAVRTRVSAPPITTARTRIAVRAAAAAYRVGFGRAPVFLRSGGTIPVVHMLERILRVPTVMMGFALPDSNVHAANENLHLPTFFRGIRTSVHFLRAMAERGAP